MHIPNRTYLFTLDLIESDLDIDKIGIVNATSHLPKAVDKAYDSLKKSGFRESQENTCSNSTTLDSEIDGLGINN
jgi:hypothetical protein